MTENFKIIKSLMIAAVIVFLFFKPQACNAETNQKFETVYISTDRNVYVAGEYLYFKFNKISPESINLTSNFGYIILRSANNTTIEQIPLQIESGMAFGSIYLPDTLQTGMYQLIGFTNWMRNFPVITSNSKEILVVNRFDNDLNFLLTTRPLVHSVDNSADSLVIQTGDTSVTTEKSPVQITTGESVFSKRSKIEVELLLTDQSDSYDLSVSVARRNSIHAYEYSLIDFSSASYSQDLVPADNIENLSFLPESKEIILSGKVISLSTGTGIENLVVLLSTPDTVLNLQYTRTGQNGIFHFQLNPYYYSKNVYLSLHQNDVNPDFKIELFDKYGFAEPFRAIELKTIPGLREFILQSQNILKVQKAFEINHNLSLSVETRKAYTPVLYSDPVSRFYLSNYFDLSDFREISRELIYPLRIRQNKEEYTFNLVNQSNRTIFERSPFVFLNGLVLYDLERIIPLGSKDIEKIEVHNLPWIYGDLEFSGIIGVFTKSADYSGFLSENQIQFFVEEPVSPSVYLSIDREMKPMTLLQNEPDFRQLLYWNPSIKLCSEEVSAKLIFYSGDIKDDFIIKVEAVSSQGSKIYETKIIKVN